MRKRLILATVAVAVIACIVLGTLAMLPPRPGVTKANFDRIEKGMTLAEVEAIFGEKPSMEFDWRVGGNGIEDRVFSERDWDGVDKASARIGIHDDAVISKNWSDPTETASEKLCRWLHWPWW